MVYNIVFLLTFIILVVGIAMIKTTDDKRSACHQLIVAVWTAISIGAVMAFIMNALHIPVMVRTMTVAYGICAALISVYLFIGKTRRMQRLAFSWYDFSCIIFCGLIFGSVFIKTFGTDLRMSYNGVDAGTHFNMAMNFLESHELERMYFAPLYNGLVMEMLRPFLILETMYKAFILADASLNFLNILMFCVLTSEYVKSKHVKVAVPVIIVFYFLGWNVWSWIVGGFVYFGAGVTAYMYGVYLLKQFGKSESKAVRGYYAVLVLVTLFCIVNCYLLFAPIFLLTTAVYVANVMRGKITKKMIMKCVWAFAVMLLMVLFFIVGDYFGGEINSIFLSLKNKGGIHRELYKDFIFLLPVNMYMLLVRYKEKHLNILSIAVICQMVITTLALLINICGFMSDYYYFKLYYLGWALQSVGLVDAVDYFWQEKRQVIYFCILPIFVTMIMELTGISRKIIWSDSENLGFFPVIARSMGYVNTAYDNKQGRKESMASAYKWINDNLEDEKVHLITTFDDVQSSWYLTITGGKTYYMDRNGIINAEVSLDNIEESLKEQDCYYFTVMQDTRAYAENKAWFEQFEEIYSDGYYGVYSMGG